MLTPAPQTGAGVPASGYDVGLTPGAPLGRGTDPLPAAIPTEPVPDVGLLRPKESTLAEPAPLMRDEMVVLASSAPIPPAPLSSSRPKPFPERDNAMQDDIQKILGSIKIPERRGQTPDEKQAEKQIPVAPIEEHLQKPAQVGAEQTPEKPIAPPVHTLKDDIQHVVKVEKMSLVRAASLEEDRRLKEDADPAPQPGTEQRGKRTRTVLVVSGLLIILGLAAILGVIIVMNQGGILPGSSGPTSLIFAEQNLLLPLDGAAPVSIKQQVAQLRTAQVGSLGSITRVVPTVSSVAKDGTTATRPATAQEFLQALDVSAPETLMRSLGPDFFFGMHSADKNAPVLIFSVLSYDNAFAAMLEWEHSMNGDLAPMFTPLPIYRTGADNIPHERTFGDAVIRNYDTRTLTDDGGTIQLYYSFPSSNLLVIAESPYTFGEVIARLRAQRRL
jgi:hypothetical protein